MRFLSPVVYTPTQAQFVASYDSLPVKDHEFWSDRKCKSIRSQIKKHYRQKQGYECCYCRQLIPVKHARSWDAEHIVPRKMRPDFMFVPENLALSCPDCNGPKSNKQTLSNPAVTQYPMTSEAFLLVHPHFDRYSDHISEGKYTYAAVNNSAKGEWTILNCDLGRLATEKFGWQEPISDESFEKLVEEAFDGNVTAPAAIRRKLRS